tara:strand:+ start:203 stop:529 length:327 start_codon:yes stop_codon:yes gene_type:complete
MTDRAEPVVAEQIYQSAFLETVWSAITEVDQMTKWFFEPIEEFRADVGFATQFNIHHEGADYIHLWKTLEVVPWSRIVYDWRYEGLLGVTTVTWELSEGGRGHYAEAD